MSFKPVGQKLVIFELERKDQDINGIIVPGVANADLCEGEVIAVSEDIKEIYKVGDKIIYPSKTGVGYLFDNKPCLWIEHKNVWGII